MSPSNLAPQPEQPDKSEPALTDRELLEQMRDELAAMREAMGEVVGVVQAVSEMFGPQTLHLLADRVESVPLIGGSLSTALRRAAEDMDNV